MTRGLTLLFAVAFFAVTAVAALDLADELSSLKNNLGSRINEIGGTPATKQEAKEQKKLTKAYDLIGTYTGANDLVDLKILGKAGKQVLKSKTGDAAIWEDVRDVVYCLIDMAKEKKGLGEDVLAKLYDEKYKAVVQKILDKGQTQLDTASDMVMDDPVKAHKIVLKAWKLFLKSVLKGEKLDGKQNDAQPDHLFISASMFTFAIYNSADKDQFIRDVILDGEWLTYPDGEPAATCDNASVAALWPEHFVVHVSDIGGVTAWWGESIISRTYSGDPTQYLDLHQYMVEYKARALPGTGSIYFQGTMTVVVSNKHTPGSKNEKIYRVRHPFTSKTY